MELVLREQETEGLGHLFFGIAFSPAVSHRQGFGDGIRGIKEVAVRALQGLVKIEGESAVAVDKAGRIGRTDGGGINRGLSDLTISTTGEAAGELTAESRPPETSIIEARIKIIIFFIKLSPVIRQAYFNIFTIIYNVRSRIKLVGFKSSLTFEVAHGAGTSPAPTVALFNIGGTGVPACDSLASLTYLCPDSASKVNRKSACGAIIGDITIIDIERERI